MTKCIFCLKPTRGEPEEHIAPEGLIGDTTFSVTPGDGSEITIGRLVLEKDEVCQSCNNRELAPLDSYLQKQLGIFRIFLNAQGTKRGTPAKLERPGLYAEHGPSGPFFILNGESRQIHHSSGKVIKPADGSPDAIQFRDVVRSGNTLSMKVSQSVRMNKRFVRALHKIAFELLALQKGAAYVLEKRFEPLREYILKAKGNRRIGMTESLVHGSWERPHFHLEAIPSTEDWVARLGLGPRVYIDLSPSNILFANADVRALAAEGLILWQDAAGGSKVD
jgi:hypothetical protein